MPSSGHERQERPYLAGYLLHVLADHCAYVSKQWKNQMYCR
jgi:hypothetical protein